MIQQFHFWVYTPNWKNWKHHIYSSSILNSQKMEATQMSIQIYE